MKTVFISFPNEDERARGFCELATRLGWGVFREGSIRSPCKRYPSWKNSTFPVAAQRTRK